MPITEALLQEITNRIVETFDPEKVILFGSRAAGAPRADSDVDLLVIMEAQSFPIQRAVAVKRVCRPRFVAMDVLVKTPEEVATQLRGAISSCARSWKKEGCSMNVTPEVLE